MIKVVCTMDIYEINGKEQHGINGPTLQVKSHWNRSEFVVLQTDDGRCITVAARDLEAAIANATRTARFS